MNLRTLDFRIYQLQRYDTRKYSPEKNYSVNSSMKRHLVMQYFNDTTLLNDGIFEEVVLNFNWEVSHPSRFLEGLQLPSSF